MAMRRQVFSGIFDRILFILAGNDDIRENLDEYEIRPDSNRLRSFLPLSVGKNLHRLIMGTFSRLFFDRILFILAGNDDIHKSWDEFEIRPILITDYRVSCP